MTQKNISDFLKSLSEGRPTPTGGSCVAINGAIAGALLLRCLNNTLHYHCKDNQHRKQLEVLIKPLEKIIVTFEKYCQMDCDSVNKMVSSYLTANFDQIQLATKDACDVPISIAMLATELVPYAEVVAQQSNKNILTDIVLALTLIKNTANSCMFIIKINCKSISDYDYVKNCKIFYKKITEIEKRCNKIIKRLQK